MLDQLLKIGLPSMLAETFAEVIPTLTGNRESVHTARKLIHTLSIYARVWDALTPDEVLKMELPTNNGFVDIARYQPWKLYEAVEEYMESRLDEEGWDLHSEGYFAAVLERLVKEVRDLADESMDEDIDAV